MTLTLVGQIATNAGLVQQRDLAGDADPWVMGANAYVRDQPAGLPVLMDHDWGWSVGTVGHLERSKVDGLLMMAQLGHDDLADLLVDGDWYLSGGVRCFPTGTMQYGLARLREISLVRRTANLGTRPVRFSRSNTAPGNMPVRWYDAWDRGCERIASARYRRADRLPIVDLDPLDLYDEAMTDPEAARRRVRAAMPTPAAPAATPAGPRVRLHGVWLDERESAELLDALDFGYAASGTA